MSALGGSTIVAALAAALAASVIATPIPVEPRAEHGMGIASKKGAKGAGVAFEPEPAPLLGTLVDVHTGEHLSLDAESPAGTTFDRLLSDRVTGAEIELDRRLFVLLRTLAEQHEGARIELVSGYRSPKLNEMLRKKGHHVASHSQHSLGHAVDFRIVPPACPASGIGPVAEREAMDPLAIEREIRALGWDGGTGVYLSATDRFVHADVGPNRRWNGL
jgi:uncharacterized protein YcbK (DUF882 family)